MYKKKCSVMYGYVRVSSKDQNIARQMIALSEFGVCQKLIYIDHQSGKDFERKQYRKLIRKLREGDSVVIKSIDRLGRNYDEILNQWRLITKEKKANIIVLDMPLLDTRGENNDLTSNFVADLVLQILSYVAQIERENIRQRQAEGIAAAKARGVKFGRRSKVIPEEFMRVYQQWERGNLSSRSAAKALHISHTTFLKWTRNIRK